MVTDAQVIAGEPRAQLFVTSKVPGRHHRYDEAVATVEESLYRAGLDYYDLYLIHWPNPRVDLYVEAYRALVDVQRTGLVRSIGVSNFLPEHIERVVDATGVVPAVNQIEIHPYFPQAEQLAVHEKLGIRTESWSPLGRGSAAVREPVLRAIAEVHGKSPVQVVLRWHVQRGCIPLPKSSRAGRQRENLDIFDFELSPDEMKRITSLGRPDGRTFAQDPATYEEM